MHAFFLKMHVFCSLVILLWLRKAQQAKQIISKMNMKDLGLVHKKIHPQVINSAAKLLFNTYIYYLLYYLLGNLPKFRLLNHEI